MPTGSVRRGFVDTRQRLIGGLMLAIGVALLGGTMLLGISTFHESTALQSKVRLTQGIVDANMRTLSQVQREILRLDVLLSEDHPAPPAVRLQRALVSQRVQEGSLSYQSKTLGTQRLLDESRSLARRWRSQVEPLVLPSIGTAVYALAERHEVVTALAHLERGYNQLVSDGETNRKLKAGEANASTRALVARSHRLLTGLALTFVAVAVFFVLGGILYARFHRQRERAAAELRSLNRELQRHAQVVRSTDNLVVITDERGKVEWVNHAFERATGYTADEVRGQLAARLGLGDDFDAEVTGPVDAALSRGERVTGESRWDVGARDGRGGRALWLTREISPVTDERGRFGGMVIVATDITERKEAEELLRSAKEAAEDSAREKANFLASMSHEIRTPLNAVLGLTDLLLLTELDPTQRDYVRTAHTSGRLLMALINDILDFSALEDGRIEPEQRAFALAPLLRDTVSMFQAEAARRGVVLRCEVAEELAPVVRGDETRLRQVLVNLIGNALKFTELGEVVVAVRLGDHGQVEFTVRDTGIGIPAERRSRLFQPFSQVDASTTRKYGGTGLGLAICRLLAERMGGAVDVTSEVGVGSTFTVTVPLPAADAAQLSDEKPGLLDEVDVPAIRVLLAEDDVVNQTVAVHMLRHLGVEPVVVGDGVAAVEAVLSQGFDLVLMDVHMPTMDGVQATAAIRAQVPPQRCPRIVAITANALEGDRERLLAAGMDDYLSKPVQLTDLASALRNAAGRPASGRAGSLAPGVSASAADRPPLDTALFAERTGITDTTLLDELAGAVVREARALTGQAASLLAADDLSALRTLAHTLGSSASSCTAAPLEEAAVDLEAACEDGDLAAVTAALRAVSDRTRALTAWRSGRQPTRVRRGAGAVATLTP